MYNQMYGWQIMRKKKRTTLTIDTEVLNKAHEIGLNVSQFCETALKHGITALESTVYKNYVEKGGIGTVGSDYGSPGEVRTPVDGSKARHACPLHSAEDQPHLPG